MIPEVLIQLPVEACTAQGLAYQTEDETGTMIPLIDILQHADTHRQIVERGICGFQLGNAMLHKTQGIALQLAVLRSLAGVHQSRQQSASIQRRLAGYPGINGVSRYSGKQRLPYNTLPQTGRCCLAVRLQTGKVWAQANVLNDLIQCFHDRM